MSRSDFVFEQLKASAAGVIARSKAIDTHKHNGLKGTFREVLVSDLILPWLPPTCGAGTGAVICGYSDQIRKKGQDDIIIYDRSLMPPIFASPQGNLGFFLYNGVLMRIEVKTTIEAAGIDDFIKSSIELCKIGYTFRPDSKFQDQNQIAPLNILIAQKSDQKCVSEGGCKFAEMTRFNNRASQIVGYGSGAVSMLCILGSGLFVLQPDDDGQPCWMRSSYDDAASQLARCVGILSDWAVKKHVDHQGRDFKGTFESGIGLFMQDTFEKVPTPPNSPPPLPKNAPTPR
jgi:hypothetical protein